MGPCEQQTVGQGRDSPASVSSLTVRCGRQAHLAGPGSLLPLPHRYVSTPAVGSCTSGGHWASAKPVTASSRAACTATAMSTSTCPRRVSLHSLQGSQWGRCPGMTQVLSAPPTPRGPAPGPEPSWRGPFLLVPPGPSRDSGGWRPLETRLCCCVGTWSRPALCRLSGRQAGQDRRTEGLLCASPHCSSGGGEAMGLGPRGRSPVLVAQKGKLTTGGFALGTACHLRHHPVLWSHWGLGVGQMAIDEQPCLQN